MTATVERPLPAGTTDRTLERLFPTTSGYFADPIAWTRDRCGEELWSKQQEIARSVVERKHTAVPSCHSAGKTKIAANLACWWLDTRPVGDAFVVTSAPTQHQVKSVLWREIKRVWRRARLRGHISESSIPEWTIDGELVAYGRKPQDLANAEEAMQAFQGIHALHVLVILDEGGGIPKWLIDAAETLATNDLSRILIIGNPDDPTAEFEKVCRPGSGFNVIRIPASATPAFTGEPVSERLLQSLVSRSWVEQRARRWGRRSSLYQSKVDAEFPSVSTDMLVTPAMIRKAVLTELPGLARGGYGIDVARFGDAETVIYRNRGGQIRHVGGGHGLDTVETANLAIATLARHMGTVAGHIDADGIGSSVVDIVREQNGLELGVQLVEFHGGEQAYDDERFVNRRAEIFWELREAIEAGQVDLDPLDEELLEQLQTIKWKHGSRGRIQIESKEDMRKRGVASPDRADAAAMAYAAPTVASTYEAPPARPETVTGELRDQAEQLPAGAVSLTADLLEARL